MQPLTPEDPAQVGPYVTLGRLGAGGMGRVYLGRSPAGRTVAVKVVRPELADDPEFRDRFTREVAAARKVSGAYTAAVIDADTTAERPWLATVYVPGVSLAVAIRQTGPLPAASVKVLAAGLAEALGAVHAAGIIHRDLKPSNVLLASDGPRVIDFGISRADDSTGITQTGAILGSPGFMAPEQLTGHPIGPPTDVFALGTLLIYAATGREAFGTGPAPALAYRVVHSEPTLDGLDDDLRELIVRCLAKDSGDRPTVAEILDRLTDSDRTTILPGPGWLPAPVMNTLLTEVLTDGARGPVNRHPVTNPPRVTNLPPDSRPEPAAPGTAEETLLAPAFARAEPATPPEPGTAGRNRGGRRRSLSLAACVAAAFVAACVALAVTVMRPGPATRIVLDARPATPTNSQPAASAGSAARSGAAASGTITGPAPEQVGLVGGATQGAPGPALRTGTEPAASSAPHSAAPHPTASRTATPAPQSSAPVNSPGSTSQPPPPATSSAPAAHTFGFSGGLAQYSCSAEGSVASEKSTVGVPVSFQNQSPETVAVYWLDFTGARVADQPALAPQGSYAANSYVNHLWLIADSSGHCLAIFTAGSTGGSITIS